jgi:Raf kinase inhibitor-like YbhB/YbcL family protein
MVLFTWLAAASLTTGARADTPARAQLQVTSSAFTNNADIPSEYTCDGTEISPPLTWSGVPTQAKSVAILVEDPDAPKRTFTHWLVTGLTSTTTSLAAGAALPQGAVAAKSDKGKVGWTGPCPPSGRHHYIFHVYALDIALARPLTRADFLAAINGHVLGEGQLVGMYQRQKR